MASRIISRVLIFMSFNITSPTRQIYTFKLLPVLYTARTNPLGPNNEINTRQFAGLTGTASLPPPIMKPAMPVPHPNPLMELLAIRLSPQAGKSLVIPEGEGANESLREFHVKAVARPA
jgi:hypothetical protein